MFSTTLIVWIAAIVFAGVVGIALIAGLAVDFARRNRPLRLARHESVGSYYGHGHFSLTA